MPVCAAAAARSCLPRFLGHDRAYARNRAPRPSELAGIAELLRGLLHAQAEVSFQKRVELGLQLGALFERNSYCP
jgi:hypothetical protein